jgi:hypothetical protein
VHGVMERVGQPPTGGAGFGDRAEERVADGYDSRGSDSGLELVATQLTPLGDDRAVAQLGDSDDGEEELLTAKRADVAIENGTAPAAESGAEHARVDDQPHDISAAAKASSSSSVTSTSS